VRLESLKDSVHGRFVHVGAGYSAGFKWRAIDTAFENRILTGAVINSRHIEPHQPQFFENTREIVLDRVQDVLRKYDAIKINDRVRHTHLGEDGGKPQYQHHRVFSIGYYVHGS